MAPKLGVVLICIAAGATTVQVARSVRTAYVILGVCGFRMAALGAFVVLPDVIERGDDIAPSDGSAWRFNHLRLGALAIFFYVGAEVAIGSILISFLGQPSMGNLSHGAAASYVSYYWGGAGIGRLIGFFALQRIRAQRALAFVSLIASVLVITTLVAHGQIAMWAIVSCGLFNSIMWPWIFPLSLEGLGQCTSQGSGILVTMVVGGAGIPEIQSFLADRFGYQPSFVIVLLCYVYILFFALRGHRNLNAVEATNALSSGVIQ